MAAGRVSDFFSFGPLAYFNLFSVSILLFSLHGRELVANFLEPLSDVAPTKKCARTLAPERCQAPFKKTARKILRIIVSAGPETHHETFAHFIVFVRCPIFLLRQVPKPMWWKRSPIALSTRVFSMLFERIFISDLHA